MSTEPGWFFFVFFLWFFFVPTAGMLSVPSSIAASPTGFQVLLLPLRLQFAQDLYDLRKGATCKSAGEDRSHSSDLCFGTL